MNAPFKPSDFTDWMDVKFFCEACGWNPNDARLFMLAVDMLVLSQMNNIEAIKKAIE